MIDHELSTGAPTIHRERGTMTPSAQTFGALMRDLAARWPDRPAIVAEGRSTTFAELDADLDRWSRAMLAHGVRRGSVVAVLCGNRPEWLVVTMAAARIGAVVAPLNTWYQGDELRYALEHSGAELLVMAGSLLKQDFVALMTQVCPRLDGGDGDDLPALRTVVAIDDERPATAIPWQDFLRSGDDVTTQDLDRAQASVEGDDALFVLYTSGSTARPKGVVLHHRSTIVNDFRIGERQGLDEHDRAWIVIPLFYAFAAVNAVPAVWTHGGALLLQESFDPDAALDLIEAERATVYYGLGNMTRSLLAAQGRRHRDISSLRKGLTGYSYEDKRLVIEDLGVRDCCGIYGLTEAHGLVAVSDATDPVDVRLRSDGRPLPGWEVLVVDPRTEEPLPTGETGHLLVRGPLTSGYLADPEQTAATIRPDGYFRTGDLVRLDADGELHFHSRLKELIKTGGVNVSPLELEAVLEAHPAVSMAMVFGVPDPVRGEAVTAVVATRDGTTVTEQELREHVRTRVAGFKVPSRVHFRTQDSLPRLASGKVAKRALRDEVLTQSTEEA